MRKIARKPWNLAALCLAALICLLALASQAKAETEVTNRVQLVKSVLGYDRLAKVSYLTVAVKNISADPLFIPLKVVVENVSPATVTVANADGVTAEGLPYFLYTEASGQLLPGSTTAAKRWNFANPTAVRFSYATRVIMVAECLPGTESSCYTGPTGTAGIGICQEGTATCGPDGLYGGCAGEVIPSFEIPDNGIDEDCDGVDTTTYGELPPDPAQVAPPVDETVAANVSNSTAFLYTGPEPIQTGVAENTIEPKRAAVLRGMVLDREGNPLPGVTITILNHPEFGQTLSRLDGMFDLAVNGGGFLTVNYGRDGYLTAQRQVDVPWQEFAWLPDVALIPLDLQATVIDLASSEPIQTAQGSIVSDEDGARQATVLVSEGTSARMVMPDGSSQALPSLTVRATEYTVGANGPQAMPAPLPPTSGYTYAVELSADEAIAAGATEVIFDRPVFFYVDNFLGFPVGSIVPAGYYDRQKGQWIASQNGKVIRILSVASGAAELDTNGDGAADDAATLAGLGITPAEQAKLAVLYPQSPKELWRVPITHFTPWDCNWPWGPPDDAIEPDLSDVSHPEEPPPHNCTGVIGGAETESGSIIDCMQQALGEKMAVAGSPFFLHYRSDRMPARSDLSTLDIPLSGATIPASLRGINLEISVAGRIFRQSFPALPNQRYHFQWDGLDAYGRMLSGMQAVSVRVGYAYQLVYVGAGGVGPAFARLPGIAVPVANRGSLEIGLWTTWTGFVQRQDTRRFGLGGWQVNVHHFYDPSSRTLYYGNGYKRSAETFGNTISTVAGHHNEFSFLYGVAIGPDGNLYIPDMYHHRIVKVSPVGSITLVAGNGTKGFSGDGGPATLAMLNEPLYIAIAPDDSVYFSDSANHRIRKVDPAGIITTIAGNGTVGFAGDGGPATQASLYWPEGLALAPDGSLYIADVMNHRIRKVDSDGIITTVAGGGTSLADGIPATQANFRTYPTVVTMGPDGSFYLKGDYCVRRVDTTGIITTVAGNGTEGFSGDGGLATQAQIGGQVWGIAVGTDNTLYISDHMNQRIRLVSPDGIINTIAGTGVQGFSGDGGPAAQAQLYWPSNVVIGPDKALYLADGSNNRIRRIFPAMPGFSVGEIMVPSEDGGEAYVFSNSGRHLRTVDTLTGQVRYQFGYDSSGLLISITDQENLVTTIERNVKTGVATAIIAPYGQRTELAMNSDGLLASLTNPAGEARHFTYTSLGLLTSLTGPNGHAFSFAYDSTGRLILDADPAGGEKALVRAETPNGYEVALTTAMGRTTTHQLENLTTKEQNLITTYPTGLSVSKNFSSDRSIRAQTNPDGSNIAQTLGPDPRFGMQAPILKSEVEKTPGGRTRTTTTSRSATLADPLNPLSITLFSQTTAVNGRSFTSSYQAAARTLTSSTPMGRTNTAILDAQGRVVSSQAAGFTPVLFTYDAYGRLVAMTQGTRVYTNAYDSAGLLASVTDPLLHTTSFSYDPATRLTDTTLPDGGAIGFTYDPAGNLATLAPPEQPDHGFSYTPVDLVAAYTPPDVGSGATATGYSYNLDRQPSEIARPDGRTVAFGYDQAGRLSTLSYSQGVIAQGYHAGTGALASITAPTGDGVAFSYDGPLLTGVTMSGTVSGSIANVYDNNFWRTTQSVNGGNSVAFQYDQDGLLTRAGSLTLTRSARSGLLTATSLGLVTDSYTINSFGEVTGYRALASGAAILDVIYTRDNLGRIASKRETASGTTRTYDYTYDANGRLIEVRQDGGLISQYTYDANGNRLSHVTQFGTTAGVYDRQDRLLSYGDITFCYNAAGDLETRTIGGHTTSYRYDELGNLLGVTLPDGTVIDYVIDGLGRRIGKKVNGTLMQGFLYENQLRIVAELDGDGNLVSRFVYAGKANVPEYMIKNGATYRIITDQLGSPRLVVDTATGVIAQRLNYDEFGNVLLDTAPGFQPFGFAGGLYDGDTGLVRFGARDYDPEVGRWTAKDPIGFGGRDSNLYVYVQNEPLSSNDIYGLLSLPSIGGLAWDLTPYGYIASLAANPCFQNCMIPVLREHGIILILEGIVAGGGESWLLPFIEAFLNSRGISEMAHCIYEAYHCGEENTCPLNLEAYGDMMSSQ